MVISISSWAAGKPSTPVDDSAPTTLGYILDDELETCMGRAFSPLPQITTTTTTYNFMESG